MQRLASLLLGSAFAATVAGSGASAADLPMRRTAPTPYVSAVPVFTWSGFYVGVNAGAGFWGSRGFSDPTFGAVTSSGGNDTNLLGGAQVGFNYQLTPGAGLVLGLEADMQGVTGGAARTYAIGTTPYYSVASDLNWFGTVRGRVGYAFDRVLVYGTAGFAYGGGNSSSSSSYASVYPYTYSNSARTGYTVGAGVEYAFTNNLTAKLEALYVNLDRGTGNTTYYDAPTASYYGTGAPKQDFGLVRAGLNYKF